MLGKLSPENGSADDYHAIKEKEQKRVLMFAKN